MAAPLMRRVLWALLTDAHAARGCHSTRRLGDDARQASSRLHDGGLKAAAANKDRARSRPPNARATEDDDWTGGAPASRIGFDRRRPPPLSGVRRLAAGQKNGAADRAAAARYQPSPSPTAAARYQPPPASAASTTRSAARSATPSRASLAIDAERSDAGRSSAVVGAEVIEYEYLEASNEKIGAAFLAAKSRLERKKTKKDCALILLEGHRLVREGFAAGVKLRQLFFSGSAAEVLHGFRPEWLRGQAIYKVPYQCLKTWSDVQTPQGICGFFETPPSGSKANESVGTSSSLPVTVICDKITEPGNMGAIIRSAAAAGCERLITTKGCVSVWEPKVIRAATGGHFHIQLCYDQTWDEVNVTISSDYSVYLASSTPASGPLLDVRLRSRRAKNILLKEADDSRIVLDKPATASDDGSSGDSAAESPDDDESDRDADEYRHAPLVTTRYSDVSYAAAGGRRVALVVGGETHGLSGHAHKLAFDRYGCRVHVPMAPHIDSLNSAVAVGVVLFEIRRQFDSSSAASH